MAPAAPQISLFSAVHGIIEHFKGERHLSSGYQVFFFINVAAGVHVDGVFLIYMAAQILSRRPAFDLLVVFLKGVPVQSPVIPLSRRDRENNAPFFAEEGGSHGNRRFPIDLFRAYTGTFCVHPFFCQIHEAFTLMSPSIFAAGPETGDIFVSNAVLAIRLFPAAAVITMPFRNLQFCSGTPICAHQPGAFHQILLPFRPFEYFADGIVDCGIRSLMLLYDSLFLDVSHTFGSFSVSTPYVKKKISVLHFQHTSVTSTNSIITN